MSLFAHHAARMSDQRQFDKLAALAIALDYRIEFRPTRYVRSWPQASSKPYLLQHGDGSHIAAFATLDALERNLRARGGC